MAIRDIIVLGQNEVLHRRALPVERFDEQLAALLDDMAETMVASEGLGLAAPQVGESLRCVIVDAGDIGASEDLLPPEAKSPLARALNRRSERCLIELINPEILSTEGEITVIESCLSVPGRAGRVVRPEKVNVHAQNRFGETFEIHGEKLLSVCLCHELDHLDGIVYVDRMLEDCTEALRQKGVIQ